MIKNKTGAMEMSVGTIVTIVLLMAVLVLGLVLIRTIFNPSIDNINAIDQKVKDQINKMFSEDDLNQVIVYPSNYIELKKGKSAGFGLSIRNTGSPSDQLGTKFTYNIVATETSCGISTDAANNLIALGKSKTSSNPLIVGYGEIMQEPIYVRYDIPDGAPPCLINYDLNIKRGGTSYGGTRQVTVEILSK